MTKISDHNLRRKGMFGYEKYRSSQVNIETNTRLPIRSFVLLGVCVWVCVCV